MNEAAINQLRSEIHGDDIRARNVALHTAIRHAAETTSLIPDFYALTESKWPALASDSWSAIRRYKQLAVPFLLRLLKSNDVIDRKKSIHLLLGLGHNRSEHTIGRQILHDRPDTQPDWASQRPEVIQYLKVALDDSDLDVRTLAAVTLDDIGETPDAIIGLLVAGLNSEDTYIQNISALHLGRLGAFASPALPALQKFVESSVDPTDGTNRPVLAAKNAIKRINDGT